MHARLTLALVVSFGLASPCVTSAQSTTENAEARVYFEEGNRLYQQANRSAGAQREALLRRALEAYVDSLQIVRSRNALFNAAIVLGELGRNDEAFNYFSEYLAIETLSQADREEATRRRDALRSKVAVLQVTTEPAGALVWVDRKDLAPRGQTPIELALRAGEHRMFFEKEGYEAVERAVEIVLGQTVVLELPLTALPEPVEPEPKPIAPPPPEPRLRLRNAAIGTAASTLATAGVALGLSLRARNLKDDYDRAAATYRMTWQLPDFQRAQNLADRTDRFNLAADVLWGTTIALGITSIVLGSVYRAKKKRDAPQVGLRISRDGGFASLEIPIGVTP